MKVRFISWKKYWKSRVEGLTEVSVFPFEVEGLKACLSIKTDTGRFDSLGTRIIQRTDLLLTAEDLKALAEKLAKVK